MKTNSIRLQCFIRSREVIEMLENYDSDCLYYLNNDDTPLSLKESLKIRNHSPSGFGHGYGGSGPAQLALAICLKLYPIEVAKAVYQQFKWEYIATLPSHQEFNVLLKIPINPIAAWVTPNRGTDYI